MSDITIHVTSKTGVRFAVRYLTSDEADHQGNNAEPVVKIYDTRYPFTAWGQFVSSYYVSTLLADRHATGGLDLHSGIPEWTLDSASFSVIQAWLRAVTTPAKVDEEFFDVEVFVRLRVHAAKSPEVLEALDNLVSVMVVQTEDGLYALGYEDGISDGVENEHLADLTFPPRVDETQGFRFINSQEG